jgi:putative NADH-flavin reductase
MRIVVVGANGRTGRQVVEQALARGHGVTAVARRPETLPEPRPGLAVATADVLDREALAAVPAGADAVVSAVGIGASRTPTTVYSQGVANLLAARPPGSAQKLVVVSAVPAGPRAEQPLLQRRIVLPLLDRVFGATYQDMRRMEDLLRRSDADWVALRPPRLVVRAATGRYRMDDRPLPHALSISYADLATALLDAADRLSRTAVYVAS